MAQSLMNSRALTQRPASRAAGSHGASRALYGLARGLAPASTGAAALVAAIAIERGYGFEAFGVVVVTIALGIGISNWRWSIYGLLLYLPFSGVPTLALYPNRTGIAVLLKDFLFVIPAYLGFATWALSTRQPIVFPGAPILLLAMVAIVVGVQALNPALPNHLVGAIGTKVWLFYMPMLFLGYHLIEHRSDLTRVLTLMSVVAVVPAVIGLVEAGLIYGGGADFVYRFYGDAAEGSTQGFVSLGYAGGGALRRIPSTFTFVTQYYLFTVSMIAVTYAWWQGALIGTRRYGIGRAVWLLLLAAAMLSGARGAFLFVPILVALTVLLERGRGNSGLGRLVAPALAFWVALLLVGAASGPVLRNATDLARLNLTTFLDEARAAASLTLAGLGSGIDTIGGRYALAGQGALARGFESWYVKAMVELGIVGLILVLALVLTLVGQRFQAHLHLRDRRLRAVSAAILAFLVWNLINAVKGPYLDLDPVNVYFWFLAGVAARLPSLDRHGLEPETEQ